MCSRDHAAADAGDGQIRTGAALRLGAGAGARRGATGAEYRSIDDHAAAADDADDDCVAIAIPHIAQFDAASEFANVQRLHGLAMCCTPVSADRGSNYLGNLFFFTLTQQ